MSAVWKFWGKSVTKKSAQTVMISILFQRKPVEQSTTVLVCSLVPPPHHHHPSTHPLPAPPSQVSPLRRSHTGAGSACVHSRVLFKRKTLAALDGRSVRCAQADPGRGGTGCGGGSGARGLDGGGGSLSSPKSACQALKENTTRSFNSGRQTQPRGRCQTAVWSLCVGNLLLFIDG